MAIDEGNNGTEIPVQTELDTSQAATTKRPKTQKVLPTDRIAFQKQMDVLRAYGQLGSEGKPVTNADVAGIVKMHANTTSLANGFFIDAGLLRREADGQVPVPDVIAYANGYDWNADTAAQKLRPTLAASWFGQALLPKLRFRALTKQEALATLAEAVGASASHKGQLETVVEFMAVGGVIEKDGDTIKIVRTPEPNGVPPEQPMVDTKTTGTFQTLPPSPAPHVAPSPGQITFNVNVAVSMAEISSLTPDKIAAFFAGIADVMKIQSEIESIRKVS